MRLHTQRCFESHKNFMSKWRQFVSVSREFDSTNEVQIDGCQIDCVMISRIWGIGSCSFGFQLKSMRPNAARTKQQKNAFEEWKYLYNSMTKDYIRSVWVTVICVTSQWIVIPLGRQAFTHRRMNLNDAHISHLPVCHWDIIRSWKATPNRRLKTYWQPIKRYASACHWNSWKRIKMVSTRENEVHKWNGCGPHGIRLIFFLEWVDGHLHRTNENMGIVCFGKTPIESGRCLNAMDMALFVI